jgi:hypothetical protein
MGLLQIAHKTTGKSEEKSPITVRIVRPSVCVVDECSLAQKDFIHIAPTPVLPGLERLHDRMFRLVKVLGGVLVLGRVAAADVAADKTFPQVDPGVAHLEALLAAFAAGPDLTNLFYVRTGCLFVWHA